MTSGNKSRSTGKLLGEFPFISRTFEGRFRDNPYVLDMDANLFIGPADEIARDEHAAIEIIFHFLNQTDRPMAPVRALLRDRVRLLEAFATFDAARVDMDDEGFHIFVYGTYDGDVLTPVDDDELPCGPCGRSVNEIKRRLYALCSRVDSRFQERQLNASLLETEAHFLRSEP